MEPPWQTTALRVTRFAGEKGIPDPDFYPLDAQGWLADDALIQAVSEMAQGLVDADLGGHVVKKRVALPGRGKRRGARTIVATNLGDRWFFL